jgi:hypothetical protein
MITYRKTDRKMADSIFTISSLSRTFTMIYATVMSHPMAVRHSHLAGLERRTVGWGTRPVPGTFSSGPKNPILATDQPSMFPSRRPPSPPTGSPQRPLRLRPESLALSDPFLPSHRLLRKTERPRLRLPLRVPDFSTVDCPPRSLTIRTMDSPEPSDRARDGLPAGGSASPER